MKPWRELAWRVLPGGLISGFIAALTGLGLIQPTEQLGYQFLFKLRGARAWDERVVIVGIDDFSLQQIGRYPWPRKRFTQLMSVLTEAQASVVTFDIIFSEDSSSDPALAQAMAQHGKVVLATALDSNGLPLQPVPTLQTAAIGTGHTYRFTDADGITRQIPMNVRGETALSFTTLQAYALQNAIAALPDLNQNLWLNWISAAPQAPQYAFADVISGQIAPARFRNKIVLVGMSATGFDTLITPFDRNPPATGVYLHATALNNLLAQQSLQRPLHDYRWAIVLFALMPGFSLGMSYLQVRWQVVVTGGLVLLWWVIAMGAIQQNYYLPTALPTGLLIGTATAVAIIERLRMHHFLQNQLQHLSLQYFLAPSPAADPADLVARPTPLSQTLSSQSSSSSKQLPGLTAQPASIQTVNQLTQIATYLGQAQATRQAITQSLSVGLLAIEAQGVVWFCNDVAGKWLKLEVGDRLEPCLVPRWLDATTWAEILQQLTANQNLGSADPVERQAITASRIDRDALTVETWIENRCFSLSFSRLQPSQTFSATPGKAAVSIVLLLEEMTDRKQIEMNFERQIQELQWLTQLKDELISRVSHELRSPITNVLMALDLLRSSDDPEIQQHYLEMIEQECLRERNLINDLLSLQTETPAKPTIKYHSITIQTWLPTLVEPFRARASTREQMIHLTIDPALPSIVTNVATLERIYRELLTNACKYSPAGAAIDCTADQQSDNLRLSVRNLGVTIAPDELPHIFEKFYRTPDGDPWDQGGTGLGLSIVERLVSELQGSITVRSQDDVTEFTVTIPIGGPSQQTAPQPT